MFELPVPNTLQTLNACGHCAVLGCLCAITDQCPSLASMPFNDGTFSSLQELLIIGEHYGLPFEVDRAITLDKLREKVSSGFPVVILASYSQLNPPHSFNGNHWCCVRGFDDNGFLVNDSLRANPVYVSNVVLELALSYAQPHHLALYPTRGLQVVGGGMNLDLFNDTGHPDPVKLAGIPYARITYSVSRAKGGYGNTDLNAAYQLYAPYINALKAAGITPIMTLGHQMFGEGLNYPLWDDMYQNHALYDPYFDDFIAFLPGVIHQWVGKGFVYSFWNEQDSRSDDLPNTRAVAIPAYKYGPFFKRAYTLIKNIDPTAKVITGGHKTGAGNIVKYFRESGITQTDGVALHPYGQGLPNFPQNYRPFGLITDYLNIIKAGISHPLYVTEFGLLDQPNEPLSRVIDYSYGMMSAFNGKGVKAACHFAYGVMDNGYPVVDGNGVVKVDSTGRTLLDPFKAGGSNPPMTTRNIVLDGLTTSLNVRAAPSTSAPILGVVRNGDKFVPSEETAKANGYTWRKGETVYGDETWIAVEGGSWTVKVKC